MDMQLIALGLSGANFALTWGLGFYVHIVNKNKATNERISQLERDVSVKLDGHAARIAHLEGLTEKAPTHEDLGRLYDKQNETARSVSQMAGELKGMNDTLRLILNRITERGMP